MKSRRNRRPRAALAWGLAAFVFYLTAATLRLEVLLPESYDPEYAARLGILQARMRETPHKPLLIVSGSSRVAMGFRTECLPPLVDGNGNDVLPFNFSQFGSGPVMNLMRLRRLLDDGVRPAWLVVELMPQYVREEKPHFLMHAAGARDYPTLARISHQPWSGVRELAPSGGCGELHWASELSKGVSDARRGSPALVFAQAVVAFRPLF